MSIRVILRVILLFATLIVFLPAFADKTSDLDVSSANFVHTLPASLASLPKLKNISLGNNHLTAEDKAKLLAVFPKEILDFEGGWDE